MNAALIVNPAAGRACLRKDLPVAIDVLRRSGLSIETYTSRTPETARRLAHCAASEGREVVLVAGGDGTVNAVVNGLVGTETALGVLPMGTGNVWATEIGIVRKQRPFSAPNLIGAARALAGAEIRRVDVGLAKPTADARRYFLLWAGVGVDAWLTDYIECGPGASLKRRFGNLAYLFVGLRRARQFCGERIAVRLDGTRRLCSVLMVHIANVALYGGGMLRITPAARMDDGRLDVCIFKGEGVRQCLSHLIRVWLGRHLAHPEVEYHRVSRIALDGASLAVQTDGNPAGRIPATFEIVPGALKVLVPGTLAQM
jgi:YegS/Rv2252/BmrU family lipid kinase